MDNYQALVQRRAELVAEARELLASGDITDEIRERDDAINAQIEQIDADLQRIERLRQMERKRPAAAAPAYNKLPRGDNFANAFGHWLKTGDKTALGNDSFDVVGGMEGYTIQAASNPTDMNVGTAADGGDLVSTGFYNQIIARRDETMLAARLPIMRVPGVGTTVDVPIDNEADGEFVATSEAAAFDKDAPAVSKKSLTLALYSKYTDVSYQLLNDTPTNLMAFLADFVGRGMAKTHNNLLLTEVATNGTSFKTFASNSAIAFGEPEDIVGNDDLANYLDDDAAVAWVMRSSTHWDIKSIVGSDRQYAVNDGNGRSLLGYPVYYSQKAAAIGSQTKSVYFGNWRYVAMREAPGITFIRDPYTRAVNGQVRLLWHFRTVYGVLQAEAVGYGEHPL
ncbi:MAG: phage major capsid protein [Chloroflexi bacterium]|nr:MAG: phage major capsid protein [Chloroflexota bacterium]